jgi:hypothetical protein
MMRTCFSLVCLLVVATPASATWSVIAIDQRTGTVVIASATCVTGERLLRIARDSPNPLGLAGIQAIVVPGVGVAAAQAGVDWTRQNQMLVYDELRKGTAPADILEKLQEDPRIESRQFAILDLQGRLAQYSGPGNTEYSLHAGGGVPGAPSLFFSVQGNILESEAVVHRAAQAFRTASGSLTDRVMAAMEAADAEGGDSRCSCESRSEVAEGIACTAKTAHVAYILRAEKGDPAGQSHNDGKYAFYLAVTDDDIKPGEDANPVKTLRMRYDAAMRAR